MNNKIPSHLLQEAHWRKERALDWFHKVTSSFSETEIRETCSKAGIDTNGKSLHALQSELLQSDEETIRKLTSTPDKETRPDSR